MNKNEEVNILIKYIDPNIGIFHIILSHVWNQRSDIDNVCCDTGPGKHFRNEYLSFRLEKIMWLHAAKNGSEQIMFCLSLASD